jgi:diaminopimelate decarboxylase
VSTHLTGQAEEAKRGLPGAPTFEYRDGILCCEEVPVERIYRAVGPAYIYSSERLAANARRLLKAFARANSLICFAVKSNSNPALFRLFHEFGLGLEVSSGAELSLALAGSVDPSKLVIGGNGRTDTELRQFAASGAHLVSVDSDEEILRLEEAAARLQSQGRLSGPVRAAIRINPDIDARVHRQLATGNADSKFGLPPERSLEWYLRPEKTPHLTWAGLHVHIGSQILDVEPLIDSLRQCADFVDRARAAGSPVNVLNIGGGLGVDYIGKGGLALERYADAACLVANNLGMRLVVEPGRYLVADACALVGQVLYVKRTRRSFVFSELAMNDLMRPAFYGAHHEIVPSRQNRATAPGEAAEEVVDVVGPICEGGDFLARDRRLPRLSPGVIIAVTGAGAYGYTMASNYNGRGRLPEVLVNGSRVKLIRRAENWKDMARLVSDEDLDLTTTPVTAEAGTATPSAGSPRSPRGAPSRRPVPPVRSTSSSIAAGVAEGLRRRRKGAEPAEKKTRVTAEKAGAGRSKITKKAAKRPRKK